MGTSYALKIFVPCRLKNGFHSYCFMTAICVQHALSSSLLRPLKPALQMHHQQRDGGRGYAGNAAGLSDGFGFVLVELLLHFGG